MNIYSKVYTCKDVYIMKCDAKA